MRALVEEVVAALGGATLTPGRVHDACGAMEAINEAHAGRLLPRAKECAAAMQVRPPAAFACRAAYTARYAQKLRH